MSNFKDVLLSIISSSDSVNEFRTKTNAIINLINNLPPEKLPAVIVSDTPPTDTENWMWYDTTVNVLKTLQGGNWYPFHEVYTYEMKFYKNSISADKNIPPGYNAMSVSPTIQEGVTVTVSEGSVWRIQ